MVKEILMIKEGITEENFSISSHKIYRFPCIGVCSIDLDSGYCLGCSRTLKEIFKWEDPNTSMEWKSLNEKELKTR